MAEKPPSASETLRGRIIDLDAPGGASHETPSSMIRRALAESAPEILRAAASATVGHPRLARAVRIAAMSLACCGVGVGGYAAGGGMQECDQLVMVHAMHLAAKSREVAEIYRSQGRHVEAEAIEDMHDPNKLPYDLRLCLMLSKSDAQGTQP